MRGTRTPRKVTITTGGNLSRVVSCGSLNSPRSVWVVNDNGQPKSPLSIERLPRNVKRSISRVARVKPRCKPMAREKRDSPEDSFPFYIDKSPNEELVDVMHNRQRSIMNESVIILDSPSVGTTASKMPPEWPGREVPRQNSVDTVDLCSEEDEEQVETIVGTKRKMRKEGVSVKRSKLCMNAREAPQPDVIVLDDENDRSGRSCNNNSSVILESVQVKTSNNSLGNGNSQALSYVSSLCETSSVAIGNPGPSRRQDSNFSFKHKALNVKLPCDKGQVLLESANICPKMKFCGEDNAYKPDLLDTVGSNVFNPNGNVNQTGLRPIIIDGCNVAISHGGNRMFSVKGLCICVEYFLRRGHSQVLALVPLHQRSKVSHQDRDVLEALKNDNHLVFTPSRFIDNRLISSYDDRFIVQYAAAVGGVIVSRDNYRDLLGENSACRDTITNRLLMPTWVGDILMFPVDPMGKTGPSLDEFLRFPSK